MIIQYDYDHLATRIQVIDLGQYIMNLKNVYPTLNLSRNKIMDDTLLNLSKTPYWLTDPRLKLSSFVTDPREIPSTCDVAIVGGGFTGLSAAITLARAGRQVTVFEASPLGTGASCRNGGLLGPSFNKLGLDGITSQYGKDRTHAVIKESVVAFNWLVDFIATEKIDCELNVCGRFRGASHPKHIKGLIEQVEELSEIIDFPAVVLTKEQQLNEANSSRYYGGIVYPHDATLHPALLYQGLLEIATKAGVKIFEKNAVENIVNQGDNFELALDHQSVLASEVIIATNGYTGTQFGKFRRRVLPIRSAMIATEELPEEVIRSILPKLRCYMGTERVVSYYRASPDGKRILFGGRASGRGDQPEKYAAFLRQLMVTYFPQLSEVKIDYAWSGMVAYTFDHIPHIGQIDGLYYAMGYCGSGVGRSNYFGQKIAHKLLGDENGKTAFDDFPFKTRPFYTGTPWFLPVILRWHSFADSMGW